MKEERISRRSFLKSAGGIIIGGGLVRKLLESEAKADGLNPSGCLEISNVVDLKSINNNLIVQHYDPSSDGHDGYDTSIVYPPGGTYSGVHTEIPNYKFRTDTRPTLSTLDFNIKLIYRGNPNSPLSNHLQFSFPSYPDYLFGDKPILFESDRLPFGPVVDVRRAIAQNGGIVQLKDLPAGNYSPGTPYGSGILTIGTRLLADLNDANRVDNKDFSILGGDWQKPQGIHTGDIVGPNGIPDGYVDGRDLGAFCDDWLADVNDPNTW
jgi:hypothetical protein